jgi:hypothetical protein
MVVKVPEDERLQGKCDDQETEKRPAAGSRRCPEARVDPGALPLIPSPRHAERLA